VSAVELVPWWLNVDDLSVAAVRAALPHILEALAEQADVENKADPGYPYAPTLAADAARWLRKLAEEARA
jgi:hypothetical protein